MAPRVEAALMALLDTRERPSIGFVHAEIRKRCQELGVRPPSRASIYNALARVVPPSYELSALPDSVRRTLHNAGSPVPGHQVAFSAFNYGDTRALSFAAGLPWACLYHAARLPGFRPKSLSLLRAVMARRGI